MNEQRQGEVVRTLSILLAENSQINQMIVSALAGRDYHSVCSVENGRLAVDAASRHHFDAILMSLQMPQMDGLTATRAIRSANGPCRDIPIIGLTADWSPWQRDSCIMAGMTEVLAKPIDPSLLGNRLSLIATGKLIHVERSQEGHVSEIALLDATKLSELEATIGKLPLETLLEMLVAELRKAPKVIAVARSNDNAMLLASEAHALKGVALNLGANRVAAAARRIEHEMSPERTEMLVRELCEAASATISAIEAWLANSGTV